MKKMEEPSSPTQQTCSQNPSLPDDLLMSCLARVSRLYYPTLSLVSKSFRSLLASPELYKARSLLGHTESCLYVYLESSYEYGLYTLCRKPDQTLTLANKEKKKKSSKYVLVKVPTHDSLRTGFFVYVAVGSDIYSIGSGSSYRHPPPSCRVEVLDCRSHTWHEAPSTQVDYTSLSASVIDRKIYVAGSHGISSKKSSSFEVFNTETQIWDPLPPISCSQTKHRSACFDGKFHVETDQVVFCYNSKESRWDRAELPVDSAVFSNPSCCQVENVLYYVSQGGEIMWCDTKIGVWRKLRGFIRLPKFHLCVRLVGYGGKMAVLWEEAGSISSGEKKIWCAEIALERRGSCEIRGKVEWSDHVLTVPASYSIVKVLAPTV
ncbi:unnamed protein product [Microthlaspi erraticum]|uniref:F-box domain-containing protein n=1 Tax=Microthlaspi erraticum TaxID=1685480 RepID=A0A6D2HE49_9BRAS|nr:unnamed protein product [Microthlaspi erraticum]